MNRTRSFLISLLLFIILFYSDTEARAGIIEVDSLLLQGFPKKYDKEASRKDFIKRLERIMAERYAPAIGMEENLGLRISLRLMNIDHIEIIRATVTITVKSQNQRLSYRDVTSIPCNEEDLTEKLLLDSVSGSIAYLYMVATKWKTLKFSIPPVFLEKFGKREIFTLFDRSLTRRDKVREILSIDTGWRGITILTTKGYLTFDDKLKITGETARDILFQRDNHSLYDGFPTYIFTDAFDETYILTPDNRKSKVTLSFIDYRSDEVEKTETEVTRDFLVTGLYGGGIALIEQREGASLIGRKTLRIFTSTKKNPTGKNFYSGYISACSSDKSGNIWVFDSIERKIRIIGAQGREIETIKPLYRPQKMLFPQEIALYSDGGFILAGNGIIVRFDRYGIPLWKIESYRDSVIRSLPPFFTLRIHERSGNIYLYDPQRGELLIFGERPYRESAKRIRSGEYQDSISFKSALEKAFEEEYRDSVEKLDFPMAVRYINNAISLVKDLRRYDPVNPSYSPTLERLVSERNSMLERMKNRGRLKIRLKSKVIDPFPLGNYSSKGYKRKGLLHLGIVNDSVQPVTKVKVLLYIEGLLSEPAESVVESIDREAEKTVDISVYLSARSIKLNYAMKSKCNILILYHSGEREKSNFISIPVTIRGKQD